MYRIFINRGALKDLEALDAHLQERIGERVLLLKNNLRHYSRKLVGSKNKWKMRVGNWRVIYEINDKNKEVKIFRIKHRSEAYRT